MPFPLSVFCALEADFFTEDIDFPQLKRNLLQQDGSKDVAKIGPAMKRFAPGSGGFLQRRGHNSTVSTSLGQVVLRFAVAIPITPGHNQEASVASLRPR
jgi:hypothetical protein